MIPILYDSNESAFVSNGLGRLRDIVSCKVTEERNGIYECDFEYPVTGANYDLIKCGRIIAVVHDETDDIQPFDIVSFTRPIDGIVTFHAVHISYRQSKMTVSGTNVNSLADALDLLKTAQPSNPFNYWTDMTSTSLFAAADGVPRSVRQMLGGTEGSILDSYGGEYEWDKWTVKLWGARGKKLDLTIRYGVNLMAYDEEVDYSDVYTSCIPYWVGSENNAVVKGNKVSTGTIPHDGRESCVPLNLTEKFEEQPTAQQLETLAAQVMDSNRVFIPTQNIKVEFTRLQDSEEYASYAELMKCSLCDSINVVFPLYDTSGRFKIVKTVYDVLEERFEEMELGSLSITLSQALGINSTSPSVSDMRVIQATADAQNSADLANGILAGMEAAATAANTTLNGIYATAEAASDTLSDMQDAAAQAGTTLTQIYQDAADAATAASNAQTSASNALTAAQSAQTSAGNALTAAQNAQTSADSALISLSNVQDVVGVLEWITAHGTMTANGSTALDPSKVYFIVDANGDYVVGGTHYSVVSEPKAEDRTSYYTLSVDESVQNYVATHLVVDTEGLWLIPDSGGNKVLIATGAGSSYTTAGTYIIGKVNNVDTVFARFTQSGATMTTKNSSGNTVEIANLGYGSGTSESGTANAPYYTLGTRDLGSKSSGFPTYSSSSTYAVGTGCTYNGTKYICRTAITTAEAWNANHWQPLIGNYSVAEGEYLIASGGNAHAEGRYTEANGYCSHAEGGPQGSPVDGPVANGACSHAEGTNTEANGGQSHAEGWESVANGIASHAQNGATIANGDYQTTLGKYNVADTTSAVIIGNGTAYDARSNALTIDWNGNVNIASGAKYKINGTNLSASDVGALSASDKYTRSSAGTLDWTNNAEGDTKIMMKSGVAYWNGAYSGTSSNLKYSANGEIIGTNTATSKTTFTPTSGSSYSSYGGCYYEKWGKVVHVHIGVSGLTASTATNIYTLPTGYRPTSPIFAYGTSGSWNSIAYVEIRTDGVINVRSVGNYCGADVSFMV